MCCLRWGSLWVDWGSAGESSMHQQGHCLCQDSAARSWTSSRAMDVCYTIPCSSREQGNQITQGHCRSVGWRVFMTLAPAVTVSRALHQALQQVGSHSFAFVCWCMEAVQAQQPALPSSCPQPSPQPTPCAVCLYVYLGKAGGFLALDWNDASPVGPLARTSYALHQQLAQTLPGTGYRPVNTLQVSGSSSLMLL
jgi:hypothetical protein